MSFLLEVCIDSISSLTIAQNAGAHRIELCSSLATGGLTPNYGYMQRAKQIATIPVYAIMRPREGDFLYDDNEINIILEDIYQAKKIGLDGVVIGALQADGTLDRTAISDMIQAAKGLGITFHRAIDHCINPFDALEYLMSQKIERVLTSGQAQNAEAGLDMLKEMVAFCGDQLSIMPGAGVNARNALHILNTTGAREIHLSGKTKRNSDMQYRNLHVTMGQDDNDFKITITDKGIIENLVQSIKEQ